MNDLMIFEGHEVEAFEFEGQVIFNPYHVGACLEIGENGVKSAVSKMNDKQVVKLTNSKVAKYNFRKLHNTGENFITESGVYKLVFKSHKPNAEKFTDWIADEVLVLVLLIQFVLNIFAANRDGITTTVLMFTIAVSVMEYRDNRSEYKRREKVLKSKQLNLIMQAEEIKDIEFEDKVLAELEKRGLIDNEKKIEIIKSIRHVK